MKLIIVLALMIGTILPDGAEREVEYGTITFANSGVLNSVADGKGWTCEYCTGFAGTREWEYLGDTVCLVANNKTFGPLFVVDVGKKVHRAQQLARGLVADVDYETFFRAYRSSAPQVGYIYRGSVCE